MDTTKIKMCVNFPVIVEPKLSCFHSASSCKYKFLDFESNVKALISCLHIGCGPQEVGLILSNLNFESARTLERAYYQKINRLTVHIRDAAEMFVKEALHLEVEETYKKKIEE